MSVVASKGFIPFLLGKCSDLTIGLLHAWDAGGGADPLAFIYNLYFFLIFKTNPSEGTHTHTHTPPSLTNFFWLIFPNFLRC